VIEGVPGESRAYRLVQLLAAGVSERLWITDAYLVAPPPLFAALCDAARGGVDVRMLVPETSDLPVVRTLTRIGYRELLAAGVRIYEWGGPMLHAKTTVVDRRWARVGSSNLNVSSLLANWELDLLADGGEVAEHFAAQFRRDLGASREIVRRPRPLRLPAKLVGTPPPTGVPEHRPSRRERSVAAVVTLRQVAGGLRRAVLGSAAGVLAAAGLLLIAFPRLMSGALASGAFALALSLAWYALARRRRRRDGTRSFEHGG
jgi:cardiolipin synthase